jgi:hypothetical protein
MSSDRRPLFTSDFPRTAALDALVQAFARGDYAHVRVEGRRLAESAPEEEVRGAARSLVERTAPDPLAIWLLVLTGGLLVALSAYWIAHGKPPPGSVPNVPHVQSAHERTP